MCFEESERDLHYVGLTGKKILKKSWDNGKKYPWAGSEIYVCVCEREREKKLQFLRYIKNVFKKDFKIAELLTKTSFFFTLETVLKMAKATNWGNVQSTCAKVTKPSSKMMAKAEVNLNWLWTIE